MQTLLASGSMNNELIPGPCWRSSEDFRRNIKENLESIPVHGVATLQSKAGAFRILRDSDFQQLIGLAGEVVRLQDGLRVVIQAAKIVRKHPDQDHLNLLISSASLIAELPGLPTHETHDRFRLTDEEIAAEDADPFDPKTAVVNRPEW